MFTAENCVQNDKLDQWGTAPKTVSIFYMLNSRNIGFNPPPAPLPPIKTKFDGSLQKVGNICLRDYFINYLLNRVPTGQGQVREICFFFKIREKSKDSVKWSGICQGIIKSCFC